MRVKKSIYYAYSGDGPTGFSVDRSTKTISFESNRREHRSFMRITLVQPVCLHIIPLATNMESQIVPTIPLRKTVSS